MFGALRRYLIAGLLVWVPLGITVLVIKLLIDLIDRLVVFLPPPWRPEELLGFSIPGLGILIGLILVFSTGIVAANLIGKRFVVAWESLLSRIPFVRTIYASVKQILETLLSAGSDSFRKVILIEYPRKGIWSIGFLTGASYPEITQKSGRKLLTIFVPTTPNPTSGFIIMVPREDAIALDMPVEDAMKLIMSLGVLKPIDNNHSEQIAPRPAES